MQTLRNQSLFLFRAVTLIGMDFRLLLDLEVHFIYHLGHHVIGINTGKCQALDGMDKLIDLFLNICPDQNILASANLQGMHILYLYPGFLWLDCTIK